MKLPYRARPGLGFGLLLMVLAASTAFFGWGWQRPPLDRVWQIQLELMLGTRPALSTNERTLLQDTLTQYPALAANMLEDAASGLVSAHLAGTVDLDYAYLLRQTADAPGILTITSPNGATLDLTVRTANAQKTGQAARDTPFVWALPNTGPFPQLTEIRLSAKAPAPTNAGTTTDTTAQYTRRIRPMLVQVHNTLDAIR